MLSFQTKLFGFLKVEDGAITVDWVVVTAGIAALGLAVAVSVGTETKNVADEISDYIGSTDLMTY